MSRRVRLYLAGRIAIEVGDRVLGEDQLARRQGRLGLAYLAVERSRPVPREDLAVAIWGEDLPESWDGSLSAVVSKLRATLSRTGLDGASTIRTSAGCHQLVLPDDAVVDIEQAVSSVHEAEVRARSGHLREAHMPAVVARAIARRPFLAGEDLLWADGVRATLRNVLVRSLDVLIDSHLALGEHTEAAQRGEAVLALEPFRESGWRGLMRAHAAAGNVAEALRAYERCRAMLDADLGVPPSAETRALHADLLAEARTDGYCEPATGVWAAAIAITFTDVVGSTQVLVDDVRRQHFSDIRRLVTAHSGVFVKSLGDGAMIVHHSVDEAVRCAVALRDAATRRSLSLRVGVHFGDATSEEGDFFGTSVVIASRLCDMAQPASVVVSDLVKSLLADSRPFVDLGDVYLKGIDDPIRAWKID